MRKRPKLRRFCKWAGFGTFFGAIAISVASLFYTMTMYRSGWGCVIGFGCLTVQTTDSTMGTPQKGWAFAKRQTAAPMVRFWWIRILRPIPSAWAVIVPLWIPPVVLAIPTYNLWRRDSKYPPGYCQECGYNLTGNVSGVCPECGTKVESP